MDDAERANAAQRLMLAVDFASLAEAEAFVTGIGTPPLVYKIGLELIYAGGLPLAARLIAQGRKVFIDAKLFDIGHTVERATASIAALGASFLTVHATDTKTLASAVRGRAGAPLKLLAVTVLTNLTQSDMDSQGINLNLPDIVLRRALLARDAGFDGVVASAGEAALLRDAAGSELLIVTPGIRPVGADRGDQSRVMTPAQAIAAGADYLVVGRPVTQARDPHAALEAILSEISRAAKPRAS